MPERQVVYKIIKRTVLIFLIGYLMYWFPFMDYNANGNAVLRPISQTRILGVLQRIALCYGIVALLVYYTNWRTMVITSVVILIGYWIVLAGYGNLDSKFLNLQSVVDKAVLTPDHMYRLGKEGYDACGILGTFPAVVSTIAGYLCVRFLNSMNKGYEVLAKIAMAGFVCLAIAYWWNLVFPYNKKLWTSSYTMLTIGINSFLFVCLIYIVDFLKYKKWGNVFEVFGKNPLFIYVFSACFPVLINLIPTGSDKRAWSYVYDGFAGLFGDGLPASFLYCISFMIFCWFVAYVLDRQRIYIKI